MTSTDTKHAAPEGAELPERLSQRVLGELGHAINMAGPDNPQRWAEAAWRVIRRHLIERAALTQGKQQADPKVCAECKHPLGSDACIHWVRLPEPTKPEALAVLRSQPVGAGMTKAKIDEIVYACRQSGDDTTYAIVNAALSVAASAPAGERPLVPERFRLVPVEPTKAMLDAGAPFKTGVYKWDIEDARHAWKEMLAASPSLPVSVDGKEGQHG